MLKYNFFELPFTSPLILENEPLYVFYEETDYSTKYFHPNDDNVESDVSTNFEYLLSFLHYDIAPLRKLLNELIQLTVDCYPSWPTGIKKREFNKAIDSACSEFYKFHPCLGKYSKYYICYILICSCPFHFYLKKSRDLYAVVRYVLNLVLADSIEDSDFSTTLDPESLYEIFFKTKNEKCETLKKHLDDIFTEYFPKNKSEDNLNELTEKIYDTCQSDLGIYLPSHIGEICEANPDASFKEENPTVIQLKDRIKSTCRTLQNASYNNYSKLINGIIDIYKEVIPPRKDFSNFKNGLFARRSSKQIFELPVTQFYHYFAQFFSYYKYDQTESNLWNPYNDDSVICKAEDLYDPLYTLEQFRNDIIMHMPEPNFNNNSNKWYFYMDFLYKKYGYCCRLPQIFPIFQALLSINSPSGDDYFKSSTENPSAELGKKTSLNYQLMMDHFINVIKHPIGAIDLLNDNNLFLKDTSSAYIINSFSQCILSDLDALIAFNDSLHLCPDSHVCLQSKIISTQKSDLEKLYKNKIRSLRNQFDKDGSLSASVLSEEEYQHLLIYRYAIYNKFSLEDYKKILNLSDYRHGKLIPLLSDYDFDYKLLLDHAQRESK